MYLFQKSNEFIRISGTLYSRLALQQCNRSCVSKYVSELAIVIFTKTELATSSLTGRVSNANKKKNLPPPTQLDPTKVRAMLSKFLSTYNTT